MNYNSNNQSDEQYLNNELNNKNEKLTYETLKKILDNSYTEIFVYNDNYQVIYVNKACRRHYGLEPSEIIGKTLHDFAEEKYWYPLILPIVYQQKERITIEQKTYLGNKVIQTAVPVLDEDENIELVIINIHEPIEELDIIHASTIEEQNTTVEYENDKLKIKKNELKKNNIITRSEKMNDTIELARRAAAVNTTILIEGESGTGKGLLANYISKISDNEKDSMLTINCAAIPEELLEAELFGYTPGAFTGATKTGKEGLVELADGGILFLDEIGELSPKLQAKLLRVVEDQCFIPVGGKKEKKVNVRIIAATNCDLHQMVNKGEFREDLYYRLNVINIKLPPLRERQEDILPLTYYFLNEFNQQYELNHQISEKCLNLFKEYAWPGNVRELENLIQRLVITTPDTIIDTYHLPKQFQHISESNLNQKLPDSLDAAKEKIEQKLITEAYEEHGSSRKVAKALDISQSRAYRLIKKYVTGNNQ